MSGELEALRRFRVADGAVDAASMDAARSTLLAHIAGTGRAAHGAGRGLRPMARLRAIVRARAASAIIALTVVVVIAVGAVFVGIGAERGPNRAARLATPGGSPPGVLRNLAPSNPPRLPGQLYCDADLAPPGATPGLGGIRAGVLVVNATVVRGVNESPFSITAHGLAPTRNTDEYVVWVVPAVSPSAGRYALAHDAKPLLLGVIVPGVGPGGKLAVEGVLPADVNGTYQVRITLQPRSATTKPGRTVLEGFADI